MCQPRIEQMFVFITKFSYTFLTPFSVKKSYIYCKTFYTIIGGRIPIVEDRELIRRIQNGQTEYLNEIAGKYYDDIYYFCCYQTGSREDAYDLAQDTFLRFIKYVEHYQYRNLKGYLLTIAMNLCREYLRVSSQAHRKPEPLEYLNTPASYRPERQGSQGATDNMEASENTLLLLDALTKIPETQREAVLLHHFYGYKNREIAHMTGASYDAVKSRIRQGLYRLKELLRQSDFTQ